MHPKKSILITGTSTGIGRECALLLADKGFKIYAGVRNPLDFQKLKDLGNGRIQPVMLDVCNDQDVAEVFRIISEDQDYPLFGLINNAGIGISGILEATPLDEFRRLFEVNLFGVHRVTRIMLPLIRRNKGRVINIGSSSSFFSGPALGPYAGSKFALRAYNDALRMEMKPFGVHVCFIAPGPVESAIWSKAREYKEKVRKNTGPELLETYRVFIAAGDKILDKINPIPSIHVANAVFHGLTARKPRNVYLVGKNAKLAHFISLLPKSWSDRLFINRLRKISES